MQALTVPAYTLQPGALVVERDGAVLTLDSIQAIGNGSLSPPRGRLTLTFARYGSGAAVTATVRANAMVRVAS